MARVEANPDIRTLQVRHSTPNDTHIEIKAEFLDPDEREAVFGHVKDLMKIAEDAATRRAEIAKGA